MPTGAGKSLVYQLPVLSKNGVAVVISPLIALMREQAEKLNSKGVKELSLGGLEPQVALSALRDFRWEGGPGFIFTSPERMETDGVLEYLLHRHRSRIPLVAIDEAHCISQWGHDFRPPYKAIPGFLDRAFGRVTWPAILCLTATLNQHSEAEVLEDLHHASKDLMVSGSIFICVSRKFKRSPKSTTVESNAIGNAGYQQAATDIRQWHALCHWQGSR